MMKTLLSVITLSLLFTINSNAQFTGCPDGTENPSIRDASREAALMVAVNQLRADSGLPALIRNSDLDRAARYHAEDMALEPYFHHKTWDGSSVVSCNEFMTGAVKGTTLQCGRVERINLFYTGTNQTNEENLTVGSGSVMGDANNVVFSTDQSQPGWITSASHRGNILNNTFLEAGVAYFGDGDGGLCEHTWVLVVGFRDEAVGLAETSQNGFHVSQAFPNPFQSQSKFSVRVSINQDVDIRLFNLLGKTVDVLHQGPLRGGKDHEFIIDSKNLPKGIYFYQVQGQDFNEIKKLILQR